MARRKLLEGVNGSTLTPKHCEGDFTVSWFRSGIGWVPWGNQAEGKPSDELSSRVDLEEKRPITWDRPGDLPSDAEGGQRRCI